MPAAKFTNVMEEELIIWLYNINLGWCLIGFQGRTPRYSWGRHLDVGRQDTWPLKFEGEKPTEPQWTFGVLELSFAKC